MIVCPQNRPTCHIPVLRRISNTEERSILQTRELRNRKILSRISQPPPFVMRSPNLCDLFLTCSSHFVQITNDCSLRWASSRPRRGSAMKRRPERRLDSSNAVFSV
jgi:hypothetical protein